VIVPAAAIGLTLLGGTAHGMFHRNSRVFGSVLGALPETDHSVSLTFDDGPNPDATPRILDALGEHGVKATFFILGAYAERWPELVRRVANEGHQIGNHGYFHRKLHLKSPFYVRRDITLGKRAIEHAGTIGWSLGVWDSDCPGVNTIVERTVFGAKPGSIILLHDGDGYNVNGDRTQTAAAVPLIISGLRDRGFQFATLPFQ